MAEAYTVTAQQVRWYRLAAHHLDRLAPSDALLAAAGVCGLQNSPPGGWETALFARLEGISRPLLRQALEEKKTLLQAWSYRGVPVVFPTQESAVFLSALAARPGEEPWIYTRGVTLALDFLGMEWEEALSLVRQAAVWLDGHTVTTKEELDRVLAARVADGLPAALRERWNAPSLYGRPDRQSVGGAVVSFALRPCAFLGQVVFGARQGIHPTFTGYTSWVGKPLVATPSAEAALVRKFLHAYGPATRAEFALWLGSSPQQTKRLWQTVASECVPVQKAGKRAYLLAEDLPALLQAQPPEERWALLGAHDPYLDARDHDLLLEDAALQRQVWRTVASPNVILQDGRVVGIWKGKSLPQGMEITLTPFEPLPEDALRHLRQRAEAYAAFRELPLKKLVVEN